MKQQQKKEPEMKDKQTVDSQLQQKVDEAEVWKNKYVRVLADYQNLEKRTDEEKQEVRMYATKMFLEKLLPVVDTLEMADVHINDEGLSIAMKELHALLSKFGVEKIDVFGKTFDPYTMECIELVEGEKNIVVEVTSSGYVMHGKLLREAKVKVGGGTTTTV